MDNDETEWERIERERREREAKPHEVHHHVENVQHDPRTPEEIDAEARYQRDCYRCQAITMLAGQILVASVKTDKDGTRCLETLDAVNKAVELHMHCQTLLDGQVDQSLRRVIMERKKRLGQKS